MFSSADIVEAQHNGIEFSFISELRGNDDSGNGTQDKPFKTILGMFISRRSSDDNGEQIVEEIVENNVVNGDGFRWKLMESRTIVDAVDRFDAELKIRDEEAIEAEERRVEKGLRSVPASSTQPPSPSILAERCVKRIECATEPDHRYQLCGWVHGIERGCDTNNFIRLYLRDGDGTIMSCLLTGYWACNADAVRLTRESAIQVSGCLKCNPLNVSASANQHKAAVTTKVMACNDLELEVDSWCLLHLAPFRVDQALNWSYRHGKETFPRLFDSSRTGKSASCGGDAFSSILIGQKFDIDNTELQLEAMLPVLGDCFCFRKSLRRAKKWDLDDDHLRESSNGQLMIEVPRFEVATSFVLTFDQLANLIETLLLDVVDRVLDRLGGSNLLNELGIDFNRPTYPLTDAKWCQFRPQAKPQLELDDELVGLCAGKVNKPALMIRHPCQRFYDKRLASDPQLTETILLALPYQGAAIIGSTRPLTSSEMMSDSTEDDNKDSKLIEWYTNQVLNHVTCPRGVFTINVDKLVNWFATGLKYAQI